MLKTIFILIKNRCFKNEKGTALYPRLFAFFACIILGLVLAFVLILKLTDVFSINDHKHQVWFNNELDHLTHDISADYGALSVAGVALSEQLSQHIEKYCSDNGISPVELDGQPDILENILSELSADLLSALKSNRCSGTYLILNASASKGTYNFNRAGLFFKRTEPNSVSSIGAKLHCLRGPAIAARDNKIELLGQWQMEFSADETSFYDMVANTTANNLELPLSRLYYWNPKSLLTNNSDAAMLLCVPIILSDNTITGSCGFEVSSMLFKQSYSPDNATYTRVFSVLAPFMDDVFCLDKGLIAGNTYLNSSLDINSVSIIKETDHLDTYSSSQIDTYNGLHKAVKLYPFDSPYTDEVWAAAVLSPEADINVLSKDIYRLSVGLAVLALISLIAAALISRRYISPVIKTLEEIKNSENYSSLTKTKYQEINDLLDFLASSEDNAENAASIQNSLSDTYSSHSDTADTTITDNNMPRKAPSNQKASMFDIDPERYKRFLICVGTLTPAEQRVFDLYLQEKKAQAIADKLNLSINTVKYHNSNIYSKLEVGSRKELLSYIRYMQLHTEDTGTTSFK